MAKYKKYSKNNGRESWLIAAGLFTGMGIGIIINQFMGLALIGLGLGIFSTFLSTKKRK